MRLCVVGLLILSRSLAGQAPSAAWNAAFDRGDRESRSLIATIRCARDGGNARQAGLFGPADSLGDEGQCLANGRGFIGIVMTVDTLFLHPTRLAAVDFATQSRIQSPIDTAAVLAVARAERSAQLRGGQSFETADRMYAPISFRFSRDTIEVWLIPAAVVMGQEPHVGGERGYVFSPDGRTVIREIDGFRDYRPVAVPETGVVRIASRGDSIRTFSEFVLANLLNDRGRSVSIDLPHTSSLLTGQGGAQSVWTHTPRKP